MQAPNSRTVLLVALVSIPLVFSSGTAFAGKPGVPDKALQKQIDAAIKNGAKFLRSEQKAGGQIGSVTHSGEVFYQIGTTALAGLALLAAGEKPGDAGVDNVLKYCKAKDAKAKGGGRTTYDTAVLLMFVTKYYRPAEKKGKKGRHNTVESKKKGGPCQLPPDVAAWVREMGLWLANNQKQTGGWGYPQNREDWSNSQYALLGLRAARDCGVKIPPGVFLKAMQRALKLQEQDGPKVPRTMPALRKGEREYQIDAGDKARGWGYLESMNNPTGSMTTSGIAILAICHDALVKPRRFPPYDKKMERDVGRAVQDGFAWLDKNFSVTQNPGNNAPNWHYYYLYGLERAAVFGGRTLLGSHDWYIEGAKYLVGAQMPDGRWRTGMLGTKEYKASDVLDTAWAILFLKKATRPLDPVKAPVVTGN